MDATHKPTDAADLPCQPSTMVCRLEGPYSYERETEPEIEYKRYVGFQNIDEWVEHALQLVTPQTRVRITIEVME
ncbi:hypothetical protein [Alicyclobacillus macrosporangiidus]|jgi:hypothetical protein|uniref:Uncharacterized protein n=1 Tax=Alicyclobacillus macrosporangiidus TaxID=392015 RepID=A0A1I7FXE1_9BACL|nr:hypothetical protein [Alicyclobacillus macrosporangiidus]SFU40848.1 hypothetical protein SAMN05421543_101501 [Alicyclobacillus macrosporangiidus]